jgi:hypothetical protein
VILVPEYLLAVHHGDGFPLPPDEMEQSFADCAAFEAKLTDAGAFVFSGGLLPAESAVPVVVRHSGDGFLMTDGPYTETKEHLGGFWIINAAGLDEALEWAKLGTVACRQPLELRPFDERDADEFLSAYRRAWSVRPPAASPQ